MCFQPQLLHHLLGVWTFGASGRFTRTRPASQYHTTEDVMIVEEACLTMEHEEDRPGPQRTPWPNESRQYQYELFLSAEPRPGSQCSTSQGRAHHRATAPTCP
ncbi:hypothetical protein DPEC_G00108700 [Dallia pectoralis]|uniref:Uncharacterized protein n=1 Tax=Dallia pectoralis TaxID=75939 RepID=A0ACC2GSP8_DALPE|nr:hypothetical protein DPEC_G00108700 [Dallia pectoralis]